MTAAATTTKRALGLIAGASALVLTLAGCAGSGTASGADALIIGTTDSVTFIDPAGSYDNGSFAIMTQVYPFLLNSIPGSSDVVPDIAASAEFTAPTEYKVVLKPGLTFANGNALTSSDVQFRPPVGYRRREWSLGVAVQP
jgi:peptide/nickel transport system substrate-binding protein